VSPRVAAKMYARAIVVHRGLGVRVTANTFFLGSSVAVIHNLGDVLAGAAPADIPVAIAGRNANFAHYGFAMPNGDRLVAVWSDGKAAENDTGVSRTITLPGSSATKVVAIDVLNGVEQELVIEAANGSLLIRDVLIRDYPTILRLSS